MVKPCVTGQPVMGHVGAGVDQPKKKEGNPVSQFFASQTAWIIVVILLSLIILALLYEKWRSRHVRKEVSVLGEDTAVASLPGVSEHTWLEILALQNAIRAKCIDGWIIPARLKGLYMELNALSRVFLHFTDEALDTHAAFLLEWLEEIGQHFEEIEAEYQETRESQEYWIRYFKRGRMEMYEIYRTYDHLAQRFTGMLHLLEVMIDDEVDPVHISSYIGVMLTQQRALSRRFQTLEKNLLEEASCEEALGESAQCENRLRTEWMIRQLKSEHVSMGDRYPQMQASLAYQRIAGMVCLLELLAEEAEDQDVPSPLLLRSITVVDAQLRVLVSQYKRAEQQSAVNTI